MEPNDKPLSEKESLRLIEEMIYKAKNSYHESGTSALLWGSIIMLCSATSFVNSYVKIDWLNNVWFLTILAVIPQIIISVREGKQQKFKSHTDDAMDGVWIAFGVAIGLASYYTNSIRVEGAATFFLILYGMPTFATGYAHGFKPMIIGGIVCWVAALISIHVWYRVDVVLMFIAAFFAWFLPGLILRNDYLKAKGKNV